LAVSGKRFDACDIGLAPKQEVRIPRMDFRNLGKWLRFQREKEVWNLVLWIRTNIIRIRILLVMFVWNQIWL